jgi:hypothetical protein
MGLFDQVVVEGLKLKQPKEISNYLKSVNAKEIKDFQTKDLDCFMGLYKIDSKGQIFEIKRKPTGKKVAWENPWKGFLDNKSLAEKLYFKLTTKPASKEIRMVDQLAEVKVKSKLTTTFNMYAYEEVAGRFVDIEYQVITKDGKVTKVNLIESKIESEKDAAKRIKNDKEWKDNVAKDIAKRKAFAQTWYYPILKETYNPFVFFAKIVVQKACQQLINATYRWHGV